ncbi:hypothetical protein [Rhodococcus sp. IEGM 1374]|uniref:hypothetical protein n=1 Tax=Rhodococcus sp. IEGM 1374 TaxID=3082221 RepID=UPI0029540658|nr:hypothetical protein [Rhodococcus sp. IEGM 1374]MDV7992066.1 hypothetical protein [Rhodococcus sp. IEGM 1374]
MNLAQDIIVNVPRTGMSPTAQVLIPLIAAFVGGLFSWWITSRSDKHTFKAEETARRNELTRNASTDLMEAVWAVQKVYMRNQKRFKEGIRGDELKVERKLSYEEVAQARFVMHHALNRLGLVASDSLHLQGALLFQSTELPKGIKFGDRDAWESYQSSFTRQYATFSAHVRHETGIDKEVRLPTGEPVDLSQYVDQDPNT